MFADVVEETTMIGDIDIRDADDSDGDLNQSDMDMVK